MKNKIINNIAFKEEEKYNYKDETQSPNKIIRKINNESNYNKKPNIISKYIKMQKIPKSQINSIQNNYIQNPKKYRYSYNTVNLLPKNNLPSPIMKNNPNNINIYNKKKIHNCFTCSSIVSGKNSIISIPPTNYPNGNLKPFEYIPNNYLSEYQMKNLNDIKINDNIPPNNQIKDIYETEDFFNRNVKEGVLYLKDFEIYKTKDFSSIDRYNEEMKKKQKNRSKTLSRFLIKPNKKRKKNFSYSETKNSKNYEIKKNYNSNRSKNNSVSKTLVNGKILERELSDQSIRNIKNDKKKGKISSILNYFNNKGNLSDIIIIRGMRSEKGGVVDFTTANPKKSQKNNNYIISYDINFKNIYKHPEMKIISSAKTIQKWWRNIISLYTDYLNKIRLIQNAFRNYKLQKCKKQYQLNIKNSDNKPMNKFIKFSLTLLKKVIEVKLINIFNYFLLKMKNAISHNDNQNKIKDKYKYLLLLINDYLKRINNRNALSFINKLNSNLKNKNNIILNKNLVIENNEKMRIIPKKGIKKKKKKSRIIFFNGKNLSKMKNDKKEIAKFFLKKLYLKLWYKRINAIKNKERTRIDKRRNISGKTNHLILKNLMIDILDKIKKEANRRTLIKAFRDINKLKYPILFYSLLKIRKYANVKYNVMNAFASLIQKNYRYYKDKKDKNSHFL